MIPTRAKGKVGEIEIILLVPRRFGKVELRPGTRENSSGEGGPMSDQQLQAALSEIEMQLAETKQLGQTDWKRPTNFDAYGWTGRDLEFAGCHSFHAKCGRPHLSGFGNGRYARDRVDTSGGG